MELGGVCLQSSVQDGCQEAEGCGGLEGVQHVVGDVGEDGLEVVLVERGQFHVADEDLEELGGDDDEVVVLPLAEPDVECETGNSIVTLPSVPPPNLLSNSNTLLVISITLASSRLLSGNLTSQDRHLTDVVTRFT